MTWNLAIACGGTGGHVNPALAVALRARELGIVDKIAFFGARSGLEKDLVEGAGFNIELLPTGRVRGMGMMTKVAGMAGLAAAVPMAMQKLTRFGADVVLGTGGYASAAPMMAGALMGKPTVLLEQNTIPGSTNRMLSRTARLVCISFPMSSAWFPSWKVMVTGNPVRQEVLAARTARDSVNFAEGFEILVLGGSQGALFLNESVARVLKTLVDRHEDLRIVHQTGKGRRDEALKVYGDHPRVNVVEYIDDMGARLSTCHLVIGRAGATTVAELTVAGVPAILVPFPYATDNHQEWNAREMARVGAAEVFIQAGFQEEKLEKTVERLVRDRGRLGRMAVAARKLGRPEAADAILEQIGGML